ncbi:hypothetical protein BGY98DRAFT_1137641, partial [Russula aff. rugulosa BPL654]
TPLQSYQVFDLRVVNTLVHLPAVRAARYRSSAKRFRSSATFTLYARSAFRTDLELSEKYLLIMPAKLGPKNSALEEERGLRFSRRLNGNVLVTRRVGADVQDEGARRCCERLPKYLRFITFRTSDTASLVRTIHLAWCIDKSHHLHLIQRCPSSTRTTPSSGRCKASSATSSAKGDLFRDGSSRPGGGVDLCEFAMTTTSVISTVLGVQNIGVILFRGSYQSLQKETL